MAIAVLSSTANLSLTAGWGHAGQNGVTMPGKGKRETRGYTAEEAAAVTGGASVPASRTPQDQAARADARLPAFKLTHHYFLARQNGFKSALTLTLSPRRGNDD